jgi:hypothetical protein
MLSRIELERDKEQLTALLMRGLPDGMETPGILNVAELRPVYCQAMEDAVTAEWGGWDGFLTRHLGFSAEDVERIKANLGAGKGE